MTRYVTISLAKRGVCCVAELLDKDAPRTADAVWQALPQSGDAYHAKYARNELYTMVPRFTEVGRENTTVTPIPGDLVLFNFSAGEISNAAYGYEEGSVPSLGAGAIDLAIFYGRNNLLLNGDVGWVPGNVFGTIVEGFDPMAQACQDVWRAGSVGEQLVFERRAG